MIPLSYFMNGEYISIDTINYIADLEQEIERLNNIIKQYDKISFIHEMELQKRVDKAIEYIENQVNIEDIYPDYNEIIRILKGVDKE